MRRYLANNKGIALVSAIALIGILAVIAAVSIWTAASDKKVTFNEDISKRAFYAADAGGEAGINWVRIQSAPPPIIAAGNVVHSPAGYTTLGSDQDYRFNASYIGKRPRPGWSIEYKDFDYQLGADGRSVRESEERIELLVSRLFREGY
jgi:hypothetical protein